MLIFIVCATFARSLCAQVRTEIPIAPEPVGSGARALGQSAFIAVADDATAASWNPAGLINLERPEASFVGAWKTITSDPSSADNNISYIGDNWGLGEINFMSYAHPLQVGNTDVVISVNYHQVYDLGLELNRTDFNFMTHEKKSRSEGAISAYSLAGGLSIPSNPEITIGASFNWYTQSLLNDYVRQVKTTTQWFDEKGLLMASSTMIETLDDFRGHNFTFGLLWDAYERQENLLTLGLVCHTPFTAEVEQEIADTTKSTPDIGRLEIDFPLSLGAGANYRFSDSLSMAFDVQWTDWSEFKHEYAYGTSTPNDTLAFRLGGEYLFLEGARESVLACRGGAFYEPRPVWDDILPVYGLSAGLGWTMREKFSLDFAYQFRWGEEDLTVRNTNIDYGIEEHFYVVSLVTYF
ncbi:MAG TPA: outer membrane protein transport protein [Sedimentisphaerales bacterium]|nr:outer membrane protein transport protein [Sedimentisphaerales bacterium]